MHHHIRHIQKVVKACGQHKRYTSHPVVKKSSFIRYTYKTTSYKERNLEAYGVHLLKSSFTDLDNRFILGSAQSSAMILKDHKIDLLFEIGRAMFLIKYCIILQLSHVVRKSVEGICE